MIYEAAADTAESKSEKKNVKGATIKRSGEPTFGCTQCLISIHCSQKIRTRTIQSSSKIARLGARLPRESFLRKSSRDFHETKVKVARRSSSSWDRKRPMPRSRAYVHGHINTESRFIIVAIGTYVCDERKAPLSITSRKHARTFILTRARFFPSARELERLIKSSAASWRSSDFASRL